MCVRRRLFAVLEHRADLGFGERHRVYEPNQQGCWIQRELQDFGCEMQSLTRLEPDRLLSNAFDRLTDALRIYCFPLSFVMCRGLIGRMVCLCSNMNSVWF